MKHRTAMFVGLLLLSLLLLPVGVAWWSSDNPSSGPVATPLDTSVEPVSVRDEPSVPAAATTADPSVSTPTQPFIEGLVRSVDDQQPIVGAAVALVEPYTRKLYANTRSNEEGRFRFDRPERPTFYYEVEASAGGFVTRSVPATLQGYNPMRFHLPVIELTPGIRVAGRVVATSGEPIPFGEVALLSDIKTRLGTEAEHYATKDQSMVVVATDGSFEGTVYGDWIALLAQVAGAAPAWVGPLRSDREDLENLVIHVWPGANVEGRVVDEKGQPIVGARVTHWTSLFEAVRVRGFRAQTTDAEGRFAIGGFRTDQIATLVVTADGYRDLFTKVGTDSSIEVMLQRMSEPAKITLFSTDGAPVGDQLVLLQTADGSYGFEYKNGRHYCPQFTTEVSDGFLVSASYEALEVSWAQAGSNDLGVHHLTPHPRRTLRVIAADGTPVVGAMVHVTGLDPDTGLVAPMRAHLPPGRTLGFQVSLMLRMARPSPRTNEEGCVPLLGLLAGRYRCRVGRDDSPKYIFDFEVGDDDSPIVCRLPATAEVRFQLSPTPDPRAAVRVEASENKNEDHNPRIGGYGRTVHSDANGFVVLDRLPIDTDLRCNVKIRGAIPIEFDVEPLRTNEARDLGQVHWRLGETLVVQVVDSDDNGVSPSSVALWLGSGSTAEVDRSMSYVDEAVADEFGWCRFDGLPAGATFKAQARAPGYPSKSVAVGRTASSARIVLEKPRQYSTRLFFDNGEPVAGAAVFLQTATIEEQVTDADGRVTFTIWSEEAEDPKLSVAWGVHKDRDPQPLELGLESVDQLPSEILIPRGTDIRVLPVYSDGRPFFESGMIHVEYPGADGKIVAEYSRLNCFASGPGSLLLQGVPRGPLTVSFLTEGRTQSEQQLYARPGRTTDVTVVVGEALRRVPCVFTVVDPAGNPIEGAEISANDDTYRTDRSGRVRAHLYEGEPYHLHVSHHGYTSIYGESCTGGVDALRFTLEPSS